jgi:AbrB family looped-hinge helix DNA binding protein
MPEATLSSKNQIVIPREARERLGLKPGDKLLVVVQGDVLIVRSKPESFERALRGIARGVYPPDYLEKERQSWDDPNS